MYLLKHNRPSATFFCNIKIFFTFVASHISFFAYANKLITKYIIQHIMKKLILLAAATLVSALALAQAAYLWPIPGKKAGDDILFKPGDYIGIAGTASSSELNFADLIISAPLKTAVLSPVDGKIKYVHYDYRNSFRCSVNSYRYESTGVFERDSLHFVENEWLEPEKIQFLNYGITLVTSDGRHVSLTGMRPVKRFKTGEKIHRGDTLGTVGYLYHAIKAPCISVEVSLNSICADPMTPFGLQTTFVAPKANNKQRLTREEAVADLNGLVDALEESMPGLYDYISKPDFQKELEAQTEGLGNTIEIGDFETQVRLLIGRIRDSHTAIMSQSKTQPKPFVCGVALGWFGDSLIVWRSVAKYRDYVGKKVVAVNGIPADSLKNMLTAYLRFADGYIQSYENFRLLFAVDQIYCPSIAKDFNLNLTFSDGETRHFEPQDVRKKGFSNRVPEWKDFLFINTKNRFHFEKISDSVTYFGLQTFDLNQVEKEQLTDQFADLIADSIPYLIIDLRNNHDGADKVVTDIYAHIAQKPFFNHLRKIVNKKGGFTCYGSCPVGVEMPDIFPDYEPLADGSGYVKEEQEWCYPDSVVNYKGRIYLLTNESSFSASSLFAGWLKKENRGVVVGRETGSAYHQMNATHFSQYALPNSEITVQIPMVKVVFDTVVNERFPFGRGVMPDYPVDFTPDELSFVHGDSILNYAIQLICNGQYIYYQETATESVSPEKEKGKPVALWFVLGAAALIGGVVLLGRKKKNT